MSGKEPFSSFSWGNAHSSRKLLGLTSMLCQSCNPVGGGWVHLSVKSSGWVKQISGIQLLPSRPKLAAVLQEVQPEFSTLLCPMLASHVGSGPPVPSVYSLPLTFLVSKAAMSWPHTQVTAKPQVHLSSPIKRVSLWPLYCSVGLVIHTLPLPKNHTVLHNQGWPPPFQASDNFR